MLPQTRLNTDMELSPALHRGYVLIISTNILTHREKCPQYRRWNRSLQRRPAAHRPLGYSGCTREEEVFDLSEQVTIMAYKYGGRLHYEWPTVLIERTSSYTLVYGTPGRPLTHYTKGRIFISQTPSIEFFPSHRWFTVSVDIHSGGRFEYYCNACLPPVAANHTISFIDLDLDVVRSPEGVWSVVDQDDFERNTVELPTQRILSTEFIAVYDI